MNKYFLRALIYTMIAVNGFSNVALAESASNVVSNTQVQIPELSFKYIMRELYPNKLVNIMVNDEDIEKISHIGLNEESEASVSSEEQKEGIVALMDMPITYLNSNGETRYLVMIEKVRVNDEGKVITCHACTATADFYIFKKLSNGEFVLISRSKPNLAVPSTWGRVNISLKEIQDSLQPFGINMKGGFFKAGFSQMGNSENSWYGIFLLEDAYINVALVGDADGDNQGNVEENSPLSYAYKVTPEIIVDNNKYYPIRLSYKGDAPNETTGKIEKVDSKNKIVRFNPAKNEYQ